MASLPLTNGDVDGGEGGQLEGIGKSYSGEREQSSGQGEMGSQVFRNLHITEKLYNIRLILFISVEFLTVALLFHICAASPLLHL